MARTSGSKFRSASSSARSSASFRARTSRSLFASSPPPWRASLRPPHLPLPSLPLVFRAPLPRLAPRLQIDHKLVDKRPPHLVHALLGGRAACLVRRLFSLNLHFATLHRMESIHLRIREEVDSVVGPSMSHASDMSAILLSIPNSARRASSSSEFGYADSESEARFGVGPFFATAFVLDAIPTERRSQFDGRPGLGRARLPAARPGERRMPLLLHDVCRGGRRAALLLEARFGRVRRPPRRRLLRVRKPMDERIKKIKIRSFQRLDNAAGERQRVGDERTIAAEMRREGEEEEQRNRSLRPVLPLLPLRAGMAKAAKSHRSNGTATLLLMRERSQNSTTTGGWIGENRRGSPPTARLRQRRRGERAEIGEQDGTVGGGDGAAAVHEVGHRHLPLFEPGAGSAVVLFAASDARAANRSARDRFLGLGRLLLGQRRLALRLRPTREAVRLQIAFASTPAYGAMAPSASLTSLCYSAVGVALLTSEEGVFLLRTRSPAFFYVCAGCLVCVSLTSFMFHFTSSLYEGWHRLDRAAAVLFAASLASVASHAFFGGDGVHSAHGTAVGSSIFVGIVLVVAYAILEIHLHISGLKTTALDCERRRGIDWVSGVVILLCGSTSIVLILTSSLWTPAGGSASVICPLVLVSKWCAVASIPVIATFGVVFGMNVSTTLIFRKKCATFEII